MKFIRKINMLRVYLVLSLVLFALAILGALTGATAGAIATGIIAIFSSILYIGAVEDTLQVDGMATYW